MTCLAPSPIANSRAGEYDGQGSPERVLWLGIRQALIIMLGAVETYLGMERSIVPKHRREMGG